MRKDCLRLAVFLAIITCAQLGRAPVALSDEVFPPPGAEEVETGVLDPEAIAAEELAEELDAEVDAPEVILASSSARVSGGNPGAATADTAMAPPADDAGSRPGVHAGESAIDVDTDTETETETEGRGFLDRFGLHFYQIFYGPSVGNPSKFQPTIRGETSDVPTRSCPTWRPR